MSKIATKLEKQLVSLAGTMLHLGKIKKVLADKPIIPLHVAHIMGPVSEELVKLEEAFAAVSKANLGVAQPVLQEWLKVCLGRDVGSTLTVSIDGSTRIRGEIHSLSLPAGTIDGWRAVRINLVPVEVFSPAGPAPIAANASYGMDHSRQGMFKDVELDLDGRQVKALAIHVPIQAAVREKVARPSKWQRSVEFK